MPRPNSKTLPLQAWPAPLRATWEAIPAGHWSDAHARRLRQAAGRWLSFLTEERLPLDTPPEPELAERYHRFLGAWHQPRRASDLFCLLFYAARELWPERDWGWLRKAWLVARKAAKPPAPPRKPSPRRVAVPRQEWPAAHQLAWENSGRVAIWESSTRKKVEAMYGGYLAVVRQAALPDAVTSATLQYFVATKGKTCTAWTIAGEVGGLNSAMLAIEPEQDWEWLGKSHANLKVLARRSGDKRKHGQITDPGELWLLGDELIAKARTMRRDDHEAAIAFRNGLFMKLIVSMPYRIGNWTATRIGQHIDLDTGVIVFGADETKEDREDERRLTPELLELTREWVAVYRNRLIRDPASKALWISDQGGPLTAAALSSSLGRLTEDAPAIGVRITAQRVRDCVATMVKEQYPEEAEIATAVLDHGSPEMTREYQEQARATIARRRFKALTDEAIDKLRRDLATPSATETR